MPEEIYYCVTCKKDTTFYLSAVTDSWHCTTCGTEFESNSRRDRRHQPKHTWEPTYKKRK
jgi:ribosomal protein L37AE/L43A